MIYDFFLTNHVALPCRRRGEAAGASFLGGVLRRAASAAGRVFRDFAVFIRFACSLAVGQACAPAFDVVTHADRAGDGAAPQGGAGQSRHRRAANHVALPGGRGREAAGASSFGGVLGCAASLSARGVFRNSAVGRLSACFLAVLQGCFEALDVVAHADRAGKSVTFETAVGQYRDWGTTNNVALPGGR